MLVAPGSRELYLWRLDQARHASSWASGIGAEMAGGRWNSRGIKTVYCSADPATAILEVAVHKGFQTLDTMAHVLTCARVLKPERVHRVLPHEVPNPNWLVPGSPGRGQQQYGDLLLAQHPLILIPSAVSRYSWNVLINPLTADGLFEELSQERFALDTRLNPPVN
ncbi:RES domain-containing protein [Pseudomonas sp. StFLB209]|uniref:RES family NAD+ phosphorylase n=1 Tax=Pseudomonas sp. StFLB209 TaxID=1028989 RepID=UPI0004F7B075|nr:RES domain-containing protein [Pseudomonas sp. StFLB209]BAP40974.1 RES domain-containing protein [Pseudomonas sp. StFLB209]